MSIDYSKMLDNSLKAMEEAQRLTKVTKPYPRPRKDYFKTQQEFAMAAYSHQMRESQNKQYFEMKLKQIIHSKHSSLKNLEELKPIVLKEMMVNKIHYGRYIVLKTVLDPFYQTCMTLLAEDREGDIEIVTLYDFSRSFSIPTNQLLPPGSILIVKEPYLKFMIANPKDFHIRVDSPSDVIVVNDDRLHSIEKWNLIPKNSKFDQLNEQGNRHFIAKQYELAIYMYTRALTLKEDSKCYSNRSAANLSIDRWYQAFKDAEISAKLDPKNQKAYYRMGKALYNMRQFEQAVNAFSKCLEVDDKIKEAYDELDRAKKRVEESETGKYSLKSIMEQFKKGMLRFDVADYVSDEIEIVDMGKRGKGVRAKVEIKKGTLLVGSKAVSISFTSDSPPNIITINQLTRKIDEPAQTQALSGLISRVQNDPYAAKQIYDLYPGPNVDRNQKLEEGIVDVSRVEGIKTFNSFQSDHFSLEQRENDKNQKNSGVWVYPSYFNHSCLSNATRFFHGDFVLIYANHDINKGEEITLSYAPNDSFNKKEEILQHFGLKCDCKMCELDRNDKFLKQREAILQENMEPIKKLMKFDSGESKVKLNDKLKKALTFYNKIKDSYKNRNELRCGMVFPSLALGNIYRQLGAFDKSTETFMELFEDIKLVDRMVALSCLIESANNNYMTSKLEEARKCFRLAKEYFVGDKLHFHESISNLNDPDFYF